VTKLSLAPGAGFQVASGADLDRYLEAVAKAGFQGASLSLQQAEPWLDPEASALSRHGLRCPDVLSLSITRNDDEVLGTARRLAVLAGAVEAEFVLSLFYTRVSEESIDRYGRCADIVVGAGAKLALEMPPIGPLNNISAALAVVDAVGRDRCCLMVDTFHFSRGTSTWEQLESLPLNALGYVQFDDAPPAISDDVMVETMDRRSMPGEGEFDLHRFSDVLTGRGWTGWVSVEVLSAELRKLEVEEFARRAYETTLPYWPTPHPGSAGT
jgi:sugar phosphate isomerase/epimerase